MPATILDGNRIAAAIKAEVAEQVKSLSLRGRKPGLARFTRRPLWWRLRSSPIPESPLEEFSAVGRSSTATGLQAALAVTPSAPPAEGTAQQASSLAARVPSIPLAPALAVTPEPARLAHPERVLDLAHGPDLVHRVPAAHRAPAAHRPAKRLVRSARPPEAAEDVRSIPRPRKAR